MAIFGVIFPKSNYDQCGCPIGYSYSTSYNTWRAGIYPDPSQYTDAVCVFDDIKNLDFSNGTNALQGTKYYPSPFLGRLTSTSDPKLPIYPDCIPSSVDKNYTTCHLQEVLGAFPPIKGMQCNEYALFIGLTSAICAYLFWHQVIK